MCPEIIEDIRIFTELKNIIDKQSKQSNKKIEKAPRKYEDIPDADSKLLHQLGIAVGRVQSNPKLHYDPTV